MPNLSPPIASFKTTITTPITASVTTIPLDRVTDDEGVSMNGKVIGFVIDKGRSTEEYGIGTVDSSGSQLTSVIRGLSVSDGQSSVTGNKHKHRAKASIEITDHPYITLLIRMITGTDPLYGVPKNPSSRTISDSRHLVDKEYADAVGALAGGITAFGVTDNGGITVNIGAGVLSTEDGTVEYAGAAAQALTDNATNYLELTLAGALAINTTGWTVGYVPIAKVVTLSGDITSIADSRAWLTTPSGDKLVTNDVTYGATIVANDFVFLDTADSKWKLADASAEATADGAIGVAIDAGADTDTGKRVQIAGVVTGLTGLTVGWIYLSDTAGDASATPGTYKRVIGYAFSTTSMVLIPGLSADELTGGNSALTVATLNEAATFFGTSNMTGAESNTLRGGASSNADTLHTHTSLKPTFSLNTVWALNTTGNPEFAMGFVDSTEKKITAGVGVGGDTDRFYGRLFTSKGTGFFVSNSQDYMDMAFGESPDDFCGIITVGSTIITSSSDGGVGEIVKEGTGKYTISGTGLTNGDFLMLGFDPTNNYLLVWDTATTIHRYSGYAGTTLTYVDEITMPVAISNSGGLGIYPSFCFDDTNDYYIYPDFTNSVLRRVNAAGATVDTYDYTTVLGSTSRPYGVLIYNGTVYMAVPVTSTYGTLDMTFIPTTLTV